LIFFAHLIDNGDDIRERFVVHGAHWSLARGRSGREQGDRLAN
jgi:hypothetical protein